MCKILLINGIKKKNLDNTLEFVKAMKDPMSKHNKDGLGYAAITNKGSIFGERWFNNTDAFETIEEYEDMPLGDLSTLVDEKPGHKKPAQGDYNTFGDVDMDSAVAIAMHTRMATSPKIMINTHPFVENNVALIHNGVIRNVQDFALRQSTCDSEAILMEYVDNKVNTNIESMDKAMSNLKGYYACGILTKDSKGTPIMDIFKSDSARLTMVYVNEIENWVFTTDDMDVSEACLQLGFSHGKVYTVKSKKLIRFNAVTGKKITDLDFQPANEYESNAAFNHYQSNFFPEKNNIIDMTGKGPNDFMVYPYAKHKNTKISPNMLEYYKSGKPTVRQLSEREVEETIISFSTGKEW